MADMRTFTNLCLVTYFMRSHLGGVIWGRRWKLRGREEKWHVVVSYRGKDMATGDFRQIRHAESWAIGLLRKARKEAA